MRSKVVAAMAGVLLLVGLVVLTLRWVPPRPPPPTMPPTPTTPPPPTGPVVEVEPGELSDDRELEGLLEAIDRSLEYLRRKPAGAGFALGDEVVPYAEIRATLEGIRAALERLGLSEGFFTWLRTEHRFLRSTADPVVFTGYMLASLKGSRKKSERFPYPLYRRPDDLLKIRLDRFPVFEDVPGLPRVLNARRAGKRDVVPYYTREEIDFEGKLAGRGLEMVWVDSLVDAHSLHVQGSGLVDLDDGTQVMAGFADTNGLRFKGVGSYLLETGRIRPNQASYQDIQAYLDAHPDELRAILSKNARYVFFRELEGGPRGSLGVEIVPHRSIATDQDLFPPGAMALIETEKPRFDAASGKLVGWDRFRRLVLNHDAGAAIKGTGRVDLYCGYGPENEKIAGAMKQRGSLTFLLRKRGGA